MHNHLKELEVNRAHSSASQRESRKIGEGFEEK